MKQCNLLIKGLVFASALHAFPASAEVHYWAKTCPDTNTLCPWFEPALTPPDGWKADSEASKSMTLAILVPVGSNYQTADAVIYAVARTNEDRATPEERAKLSNEKWLKQLKTAKIERKPDVSRSNGKGSFVVYHYDNIGSNKQRAELVAFGEDVGQNDTRFNIQIVLTTDSADKLQAREEAFRKVLAAY